MMKHMKPKERASAGKRRLSILLVLLAFVVAAVAAIPASASLISVDMLYGNSTFQHGLSTQPEPEQEPESPQDTDNLPPNETETVGSVMLDIGPNELGGTTRHVPILMYHSFTEDPKAAYAEQITSSLFLSHISALYAAGYETVTLQQLYEFVENGVELPEKPIVITFDDGYKNNLDLAAPILAQYGYCAEVSVIGVSVGHTTYKDTDIKIIPHFTMKQAKSWADCGVINLHSHSYDMHQLTGLDGEDCRQGALPLPGEDYETYRAAFISDHLACQALLDQAGGEDIPVFTYPYGYANDLSERVLDELNIPISLSTRRGIAEVSVHNSATLRMLPRLSISHLVTADDLIHMIESEF